MATKSSIQSVFEKNQYDLATAAKKSTTWFNQQALLLTKQQITPGRLMNGEPDSLKTSIMPGKLYMYFYDPKLKAELPYYDRFPLVFPFRKVQGGFLGLNMHYLPYPLRVKLLDALMMFKSNDKMNEATKLKYSWSTIDGISKFKAAQPCVKHYLIDHVRSPFKVIPSYDWTTAMLLPVEKFVGANKLEVWADSKKRMR